jgi:hypothetical protein
VEADCSLYSLQVYHTQVASGAEAGAKAGAYQNAGWIFFKRLKTRIEEGRPSDWTKRH